jgi:hypothetical protein
MARKMEKTSSILGVQEFETKGFIKHIDGYLLPILRNSYGRYLRIFNSGYNVSAGRSGAKYGTYEVFGERICYYYDYRKEKEFTNHLVDIFYRKNPIPDIGAKKSFTRLLHAHGLHWAGCIHCRYRYD